MKYALEPIVSARPRGHVGHVAWWELLYRNGEEVDGHRLSTPAGWRAWYAELPKILDVTLRKYPGARVSVNVSTYQLLDDSIRAYLIELVSRHSRVALEWTEDPLKEAELSTKLAAARFLLELRNQFRVEIGIDDVGAGDDGLGRIVALRELPDFVKLDGGVLTAAQESKELHHLLRAHIRAYRAQGISVVGEKIETSDQVDLCCSLGMNFLQGYFFNSASAVLAG